jgi:glycosyltransferase involved in cell wall biosynthesis
VAEVIGRVAVVRLVLGEPLGEVVVGPGYSHALMVVLSRGEVVGELLLEAPWGRVSGEVLRAAIRDELGEGLWRQELAQAFVRATRGGGVRSRPEPDVSVVVCTRDRPEQLRACLDSLRWLRTRPLEVVVVDNAPSDERARELCETYPEVRYVREPVAGLSRARNRGIAQSRGELVAFTDDDCVVDPGWLDGLGETFADPLVMVAVGYVGPLELETRGQCVFQLYGSFARRFERTVYDGLETMHTGLGDGNCFVRREAFAEVGLFAEDLGPGTPAKSGQDADLFHRIFLAAYRLAFEPARITWHQGTAPPGAVYGRAVGQSAATTRWLFGRRDLRALGLTARTWGGIARRLFRVPLGLTLRQAAGKLAGPVALLRSRLHARRGPAPLRLAPPEPEPVSPRVVEADDPRLSVTIASYNRRERLGDVLRALGRQSYPAERFEVVLVLDGSTDGSAEMARALELPYSLRVLEQENRGLAASRNRGGREAENPVVVWLDDDVVPLPGFLSEHAGAHRRAREDHIALGSYPPAPQHGETNLFSLQARQWWVDYFARKEEPDHKWTFVDFADGNISAPPSLIFDAGGWDEDFAKGSVRRQDWEFGIRLLERNVRFGYYPDARGDHHFNTSFATAVHNRRVEGNSDVVLVRKHPQVAGYLFMSRIARTAARGGLAARFMRFSYRRPAAGRAVTRSTSPFLRVLEAANARRPWWAIAGRVLSHAYLLGVRDGLGSDQDLGEVIRGLLADERVTTVPVQLGGRFELPQPIGAMDLLLSYGDVELGNVPAIMPEEQWDWDALAERVSRVEVPDRLGPAPAVADPQSTA